MNIEDMVVVITGASSGIGRATALEFARRGGTVVVAARRGEALDEVVTECQRIGGRALAVSTDVTNEADLEELARRAVSEHGRVDVWVNNAAVSIFGRFEEIPTEAFRRVLETNILGYIYGARAVLPYFREQGRGVLINISSMVGAVGQPYSTPYTISKFAIRGLSLSLEQELADEQNIHVCSVLPAVIDTPIFNQAANYSGRAIKPPNPILHAQKVADAIVALAKHPKKEIHVGAMARAAMIARMLSPWLYDRMMNRLIKKDHFQDLPASPTKGNLFAPMPEWAKVSGGWKEWYSTDSAISTRDIVISGAVISGFLACLFLLRRRAKES